MGGWRRGAQLAAASNWAEQVSMADQTRMQHGSKAERPATGWRLGGRRGGVKRAGGRAGERLVTLQSSQPLCVGGGGGGVQKEPAVTP